MRCTKTQLAKNPIVPVNHKLALSKTRNLEEKPKHTSKHEPKRTRQRAITQIKHPRSPARKTQRPDPIEHGVQKDIDGARTADAERAPLPVIVLGAEDEIRHQHSNCSRSDDHEAKAQKQEAEHVVNPAEPDAVHDEVELDEDGAKGQDADQQHAGNGTHVARAGRDLAGDLVGADGRGEGRGRFEAQPGAAEGEREGDDEPDADDDEHGRERHGAGRLTRPDEEVEEEKRREHGRRDR